MAFPLRGSTAVITGAAGGIGAALAANLAGRGTHLALADRNADGLARVAEAARAQGVRVSEHALDVADRAALEALPEAVLAEHGSVQVLVNNAGVALAGNVADVSLADIEWLFDINFWAPVRLTRAFMFALNQETAAHIVQISSLFGIIAPPGQAAYCASKFALRGFSKSSAARAGGWPGVTDGGPSRRRAHRNRAQCAHSAGYRSGGRARRDGGFRQAAAHQAGGRGRVDRASHTGARAAAADQGAMPEWPSGCSGYSP